MNVGKQTRKNTECRGVTSAILKLMLRIMGRQWSHWQWRQRESNFGGDAEGIKEQLQGIKRVSFLLDDNVGAIESVVESLRSLCKTAELGLNESLCENDDNCG